PVRGPELRERVGMTDTRSGTYHWEPLIGARSQRHLAGYALLLRLNTKNKTGTVMRESSKDAISPAIKAIASPWKIGSNRITDEPTITAAAVSIMGRKRTAPASMTAWSMGIPSARRNLMKSTRMMELRTTMPAPAMKPVM